VILDLTSGNRSIWFSKEHQDTIYIDLREVMRPDVVADCQSLPFRDGLFGLIVFDPWPSAPPGFLQATAQECARVATPEGLLAFKWSGNLDEALKNLEDPWEPLFGHALDQETSWAMLRKRKSSVLRFRWE
jgi:SAM-dependent methyltransferase